MLAAHFIAIDGARHIPAFDKEDGDSSAQQPKGALALSTSAVTVQLISWGLLYYNFVHCLGRTRIHSLG